jgi:hypothetical protein
MSLQPIGPEDSRIEHKTALLNGITYHYLYGVPKNGQVKATIFLVSFWSTHHLPVVKRPDSMLVSCNAIADCTNPLVDPWMA